MGTLEKTGMGERCQNKIQPSSLSTRQAPSLPSQLNWQRYPLRTQIPEENRDTGYK
jgi:hypothetical protein